MMNKLMLSHEESAISCPGKVASGQVSEMVDQPLVGQYPYG